MGKHHQILKEHEELDRRIGMAIRRLTDHIKRLDDGTFLLNVTDGAALEIDAITFADLRRSLEETNRKIKAGVLKKEDISWP